MGKCKTKTIQTDLDIFMHIPAYTGIFRHPDIIRHIQVYSRIIQAYYEPCVTLVYSEPEAYSEPCYIQNSGTFRTTDIFRILGYSEPEAYLVQVEHCQTSTMQHNSSEL